MDALGMPYAFACFSCAAEAHVDKLTLCEPRHASRDRRESVEPASAAETLKRLELVRSSKPFQVLLSTLEVDRDEWEATVGTDGEDYPGEARERVAMYDALWLLLTGRAYRPCQATPRLRLVGSEDEDA